MSTDASQGPEDPVEQALLGALRQRADAHEPSAADEDDLLIAAAVDAHLAAAPGKTRRRLGPWIAATGLLAAAAATALWLLPDSAIDTSEATTVGVVQPTTPAPTQAMWVLERDGSEPSGVTLAGERETCGVRARGTRACLMPGSRGTFAPDGNLQLHQGSARVEAGEPIIMFLPDVRVEAATDSASFVATRRGQQWTVVVDSGTVTVTGPDGSQKVLEAGESTGSEPPELATVDIADSSAPGDAPVPEPSSEGPDDPSTEPNKPPSADELLARARTQRAARNFAAAAQSYERLIQAHPNSAKVRATLVSLAQLYQGPLDEPAKALDYFERYLERGGPLAEDAHYGKIRALRSLGRSAEAATEVESFLATYPNSPHALKLSGE